MNFLEGEEKAARARTAFSPAHRARLQAVKQALDPACRFDDGIRF